MAVAADDEVKENIKKQFRLLDLESSGAVTRGEMVQVLQTLDSSYWKLRRVNGLFDSMDANKDGKIQIDEFIDWVFANSDADETPSFFAPDEVRLLREKNEEGETETKCNDWLRAGACSACGPRPQNEDQHITMCDWNPKACARAALFAVFDGHGGHAVSILASRLLAKILRRELETLGDREAWASASADDRRAAVERAFLEVDGALASKDVAVDCGSTCVACVLWPDGGGADDGRPAFRALLANVGDSRGLVVRGANDAEGDRDASGVLLETVDHKPDDPGERDRIVAAGGFVSEPRVGPARVDGDLAMSRAFGDFRFKRGKDRGHAEQKVIPVPDVYEVGLQLGDFVVLACDGAFDVYSSVEVAGIARGRLQRFGSGSCEASAGEAASAVVNGALRRRSMDNVTCVVVEPFRR